LNDLKEVKKENSNKKLRETKGSKPLPGKGLVEIDSVFFFI